MLSDRKRADHRLTGSAAPLRAQDALIMTAALLGPFVVIGIWTLVRWQ